MIRVFLQLKQASELATIEIDAADKAEGGAANGTLCCMKGDKIIAQFLMAHVVGWVELPDSELSEVN